MTEKQGDNTKAEAKKPEKRKIKVLRPSQVVNKNREYYDFKGDYLKIFGKPERIAKWFITGPSYSGKSSFMYELCEYLCQFGKIDYDSFEEGDSGTTARKMEQYNLNTKENESKFRLLPKVPLDDLTWRLKKKQSARFVVVDSIQHCGMKYRDYVEFTNEFCSPRGGKSLIFVSHWIKNDLTKFVKHDCDIKIEVVGFVAKVKSRYSDEGIVHHVLWEKGARAFWGKKYTSVKNGKYWPYKD